VSRPGESLNLPTACRFGLDHAWKDVIADLIPAAGLVVVDASGADGVRWEVSQCSPLVVRRKLVIALATGRAKRRRSLFAYNHICELITTVFAHNLPDTQEDLYFLSFDGGGSLREHRLAQTKRFPRRVYGGMVATLLDVLRLPSCRVKLSRWARGPVAVAAVLMLWTALVVLAGASASAIIRVQERMRLDEYRRADEELTRQVKEAGHKVTSDGSGLDGLAKIIEESILRSWIEKHEQSKARTRLAPRRIADLSDQLESYEGTTVSALRRCIKGLKTGNQREIKAADEEYNLGKIRFTKFLDERGIRLD